MERFVPGLAVSLIGVSLVIAWLVVRVAIGYAHRRGMLDLPGRRRSHVIPTARGGGIGIVAAVLVCLPFCLRIEPDPLSWLLATAIWMGFLAVAMIGWWDDHHPLPVLPRLMVQTFAAVLVACALGLLGVSGFWMPVVIVAGVGSVNLHNFMDGIDGLLAEQAIFVFLAYGLLGCGIDSGALAVAGFAVAAACLGFWTFNHPPAKIFMGDVGSGALGFLVFAMGVALWFRHWPLIWPVAIVSSSFVIDAGLTLAVRVLRGRRWYSAHREHVYQWLVRRGATHRRAAGGYLMWNLFFAAPMAWLAWRFPREGGWICLAVYLAGSMVWAIVKRWCLQRRPRGVSHVGT